MYRHERRELVRRAVTLLSRAVRPKPTLLAIHTLLALLSFITSCRRYTLNSDLQIRIRFDRRPRRSQLVKCANPVKLHRAQRERVARIQAARTRARGAARANHAPGSALDEVRTDVEQEALGHDSRDGNGEPDGNLADAALKRQRGRRWCQHENDKACEKLGMMEGLTLSIVHARRLARYTANILCHKKRVSTAPRVDRATANPNAQHEVQD